MSKSKRTKYGHKLMRVAGSPYWYVEGFDWQNKSYRVSTKQVDDVAAAEIARRIAHEKSVPGAGPYALASAFVDLLAYKKLCRVSDAEMEITRTKAARVMEHFGELFDINKFEAKLIDGYVAARRAQQVNAGYKTQRGISDATIGKELAKLMEALRLAHRDKHFRGDVEALKTHVLHASKPRKRFLTDKEYIALWDALTPKGNLAGTKAEWILKWSADMPAKQLVEWARMEGIELTKGHIWTVRYEARQRAQGLVPVSLRVQRDRRDYLLIYCSTGARYGELGRIEAKHIDHDLENGGRNPKLFLIGKKGVEEFRERFVPLSPQAYTVLCERAEQTPEGRLFEPWSRSNLNQLLKRACERIGIPRVTTNDLRRTFVTWAGKLGTDNADVKKMVGHSPGSRMVDAVYRQLGEDAGRTAVNSFPRAGDEPQPVPPADNVVQLPIKKHRRA